jgi:hypothetical protein
MAADLGVTAAAIHRWENGQRMPRRRDAVRYREILAMLEGDLRARNGDTGTARATQ